MSLSSQVEDVGSRLLVASDASVACTAMRRLLQSQDLAHFLSALTASPTKLRQLSELSQVHPNAFNKIPLARASSGAKLVVHDWHSGQHTSLEEIHNHRWSFCSAVLSGAMVSQKFIETDLGSLCLHKYKYRSPGGGVSYPMMSLGEGKVAPDHESLHVAGTIYHQPHDGFHRARVAMPGTLTLIVQGPVLADYTTVYSTARPKGETHRPVVRSDVESVRSSLERILSLLNCSRGIE
ncbi:hypothetical protein [Streptomyces sp. NPDC054804]